MLDEIKVYLEMAKEISIKLLIALAVVYVLYRIIVFILDTRKTTLEVIRELLFGRESYIQLTSDLEYLRKHFTKKSRFLEIKEQLLEEPVSFYEIIDYYQFRKKGYYYIFCEYKDATTDKRYSQLAKVKLNLIGSIRELSVEDYTGREVDYLFNH